MIKLKYWMLALLLVTTACAGTTGAWKTTYVAASVTSQLVEDTHRIWWAEPFAIKLIECDPETRPDITRTSQYDACLGVYAKNDKVLAALEAYNQATVILERALLATNPDTMTDADMASLVQSWNNAIKTATHLLGLLPGGHKHVDKLQRLTR